MAVTPRLIARLELTYTDGTTDAIASDPSFKRQGRPDDHRQLVRGHRLRRARRPARLGRAGRGPLRRQGLGGRSASPRRRRWTPSSCGARPRRCACRRRSSPSPIKQVAQRLVVVRPRPELRRHAAAAHPGRPVPAGTVIKIVPGESWSGNGTVSTASAGSATGILDTYTTVGDRGRRDASRRSSCTTASSTCRSAACRTTSRPTTTRSSACRPTPTSRRAARSPPTTS